METQNKKSVIKLDPESIFEMEIAKRIKNFIGEDYDSFYHIFIVADKIIVEKQGYNTPAIDTIEFDTQALVNNELFMQTKDAIVSAYQYTFLKTGSLKEKMVQSYPYSDLPNTHAFYHDRTCKYPESDIIDRIMFLNKINSSVPEENISIHK